MTKPSFFERRGRSHRGRNRRPDGSRARSRRSAHPSHRQYRSARSARGPADLSYVDSAKYVAALASTHAGACLMTERFESRGARADALIVLRTKQPLPRFRHGGAQAVSGLAAPVLAVRGARASAPGAFVHPTARLEDGVTIDPGAVIGPRAAIGAGTVIGANAVIGPDVADRPRLRDRPGRSIMHALIGDRVIIHRRLPHRAGRLPLLMGAKGHVKVPQLGRVIIQDDVEIGAGTTDRPRRHRRHRDRRGHQDRQSRADRPQRRDRPALHHRRPMRAVSGSVTLEDFVVLAARVGIVQHITIGEGAHVGSRSTVLQDVPPGARWCGAIRPSRSGSWMREMLTLERMAARGGAESRRRMIRIHPTSWLPGWHSGRSRASRTNAMICATASSLPNLASTASTRRARIPSLKNNSRRRRGRCEPSRSGICAAACRRRSRR